MKIHSRIEGHVGPCKPIWLNRNEVFNRLDGGITGFFKNVRKRCGMWWKYGPEFHGIIRLGEVVATDKGSEDV